VNPTAKRVRLLLEKLRLRLSLAWAVGTGLDRAHHRSLCTVSFAQSGEDIIASFIFSLLGIGRPRYLDIGAHDPVFLNNTALFSLLGATGVNIEPDPVLFRAFVRQRPHDTNLNIGISESSGMMTFFRMSDPTLSTFSEAEAVRVEQHSSARITGRIELPVEPIGEVLRRLNFTPDFLTIDVEGRDLAILRTYDFEAHRPIVICAETVEFSFLKAGPKNRELIDFVTSQGYGVYADTFINTIFVDRRRLPIS
jgi:FkbM family methyltransferase